MNSPSILFVICDQLNATVPGCYGGPVDTPNIDRLAGEGVRFTDAVTPCPMCSPTRASICTGQYPRTHGMLHNMVNLLPSHCPGCETLETEQGITDADVTLGRLLHESGYHTHHYGTWHLAGEDISHYPDQFRMHVEYPEAVADTFEQARQRPDDEWMEQGTWALPVEVSDAVRDAVEKADDFWTEYYWARDISRMGRLEMPLEEVFDVQATARAVNRLQEVDGEPFMITCSMEFPHNPSVCPSPYYEMFEPDDIELPANIDACEKRFEDTMSRRVLTELGEAVYREFLRCYYGKVKLVDDQLGRLLDALEATGQAENTIVIFTTDHGDFAGNHGMVLKIPPSLHDDLMNVPLIARYPAGLEPAVSDLPISHIDLMPTLLDLTGHEVPDRVQGQSLVPYLHGDKAPDELREYQFGEFGGGNPRRQREIDPDVPRHHMVRGDGYKYIVHPDGEEFLYDINADPGEMKDLSDDPDLQEQKSHLQGLLEQWKAQTPCAGSQ
ncbi:MAG: sulfatase-like hydrolase/transferase [Armatimonadota bacterium]